MYPHVLMAHGAWRWIVLGLGVVVVLMSIQGLLRPAPWEPRAALWARLFGIAVDIQVVLGAALYLTLSPLTTVAVNIPGGMQLGSDLRFIGIEHAVIMLGALIAVHLASVLVRRAGSDAARFRRALQLYGLTLLLIIAGTPWWRPLLRL